MLTLPPPLTPRMKVVAAARRRGFAVGKIAHGLGVSPQAVQQQLCKIERWYGKIDARIERKRVTMIHRMSWKCPRCGTVSWGTPCVSNEKIFCSDKCWRESVKVIYDEHVRAAIDMRRAGQTWKGIGKVLGVAHQTVQRRIWVYLAGQGVLTMNMVDQLWKPSPGLFRKYGRWKWLENRTGLSPQER